VHNKRYFEKVEDLRLVICLPQTVALERNKATKVVVYIKYISISRDFYFNVLRN
jgi:hypothetical protein